MHDSQMPQIRSTPTCGRPCLPFLFLLMPGKSLGGLFPGKAGRLWHHSLLHVTEDVPGAKHPRKPEVFTSGKSLGRLFPGKAGTLAAGILVLLTALGCGRFERHPVVQVAVEEVGLNPRVKEAIGGPVRRTGPVTGSASDADGLASLQFDVAGPSGTGTIVVEGKRLGAEWGVTLLELRRPGSSEHLMLTGDLEARTGTDTPRFDPSAAPAPRSSVPPPPSEIEIPLPPGAPGS